MQFDDRGPHHAVMSTTTLSPAPSRVRTVAPAPPVTSSPPAPPAPPRRRAWSSRTSTPQVLVLGADALAVTAAVLATLQLGLGQGGRLALTSWQVLVFVVPVFLVAFARAGLYRPNLLVGVVDEVRRLLNGVVGGTLGVAAMGYLGGSEVASGWLLLLSALAAGAVVVERLVLRGVFTRLRRRGRFLRRVVLVGDGPETEVLADELREHPEIGYEVTGVLPRCGGGGQDPVTRVLVELERRCATGVIVVPSGLAPGLSTTLVNALGESRYHVEVSCAVDGVAAPRLTVRPLGTIPVMYVDRPLRGGWRRWAKRAFDVAVATAGLVVSLPLLLVAAALIRLDSPGPVIFRQQRVGRHGAPIQMLKLRTMVVDAEDRLATLLDANEAAGPLFKVTDDPRVTRVGRVLRELSIDELPQLWNVIRGDMSLVGPRPALEREMAAWPDVLHDRLQVVPGITGMWQVMGRADARDGDYEKYDLYYVRNWSLWTDVAILLRTVPAVLARRGAS